MTGYLINELRKLKDEAKNLDFKTVYIFVSVALIIFISLTFSSPAFYLDHIGDSKLFSRIYWFLTDGLIMFIVPVLSVKFIFKEKISEYGLAVGDFKFGMITAAVFYSVMLVIVWIVSASPEFIVAYPQGGTELKKNLQLFVIYELCIFIYMLGWEFLWRGYMLFGLFKKLGYYSIFIQMIPFFILHKGKPDIELFASIFAGIILGIQAIRSRSFIYSWMLHCFVMLSIDLISVLRYKFNFYSIL
ncbi:MAG: CPBP family intramembrane metalloprotease [Ignavibacteria bacterium]|nr:CPBP family intramembrane metalloprotease [Ignavibacteria bacterium]